MIVLRLFKWDNYPGLSGQAQENKFIIAVEYTASWQ